MIRWLYNFCFPFVFLLLLPGFLRRMVRRGRYQENFGQRLGMYSAHWRERLAALESPIWVQAVSVGEMLTALKLIAALRDRQPALSIVISTTTTTGYQLALDRVGRDIPVVYTPIDFPVSVRHAFDAIRPCKVVIVDGGLWPNLLWEAKRRKIPTALVNARLSPRSERRFRKFGWFARPMFAPLGLVCVPEPGDLERWQTLGVKRPSLRCTGSVKFDDAPRVSDIASGSNPTRPRVDEPFAVLEGIGVPPNRAILLAGSTHPGEETLIARAFLRLRDSFPGLFLIVAPRHVERAREVAVELRELGLRVIARTELASNFQPPKGSQAGTNEPPHFDGLLLDTTGELNDWYPVATVVFIGKSLAAIGGQNPAEAIMAGKPVVFGPHMENFADLAAALLTARGAIQTPDAEGLVGSLEGLLRSVGERERMATAARAQLLSHRGAAARTAELLIG